MRDDFMCIDFVSRGNERKIIYNIGEYNDNAIINRIKQNHKAYEYIELLNKLLNKE